MMSITTTRSRRCFSILFPIAAIIILILFYNLDVKRLFISHTYSQQQNSGFEIRKSNNKEICKNIEDATQGRWELKPNLSRLEIKERERLDVETRLYQAWPAQVFRNDSRCGKQGPLGYRLLAQCDAQSDKPCCHHSSGRCGNGPEFCNCDECTDQRKFISAELGSWIPNTCTLKSIKRDETCRFLFENGLSLIFIGDSLIKHIFTMMLLLLTDNYAHGALHWNATHEEKKLCEGEKQIINKVCSIETVPMTTDRLKPNSVCDGKVNVKVDLVQFYKRTLTPDIINKLKSILNLENYWVVTGVGLHYRLDFTAVKTEYLDKVWGILRGSHNGWPKIIWIGIHGQHGFLRMQTGPNNKRIQHFNQKVNAYWKKRNVTVIETFDMSTGVRSYDGVHYGFGFNRLKLKILLNHFYQIYRM